MRMFLLPITKISFLERKNAKYGFMTFEGVGTVTTNFQAPKPGWYEIECAGFSMSQQDHDAFLFARVIPDNQVNQPENTFPIPEGEEPTYGVVTLGKLPYGTYTKESYESCLEVATTTPTGCAWMTSALRSWA